MTKLIGDKKVINKLEQDAMDFLLGKISGNLWPYLYGTPEDDNDPVQGGILYNEMLKGEKDYYLYKYEAELFQGKGNLLTEKIGGNATFVELGPGSETSIRLKTLPLLRSCDELKGYLGIDISQDFVDKVVEVIRAELPNISVEGMQQDFTQLETLPEYEKPVVLFKGSTIANLRKEEVPVFIAHIKELIGKPHYLLLVHDANQDEVSLMKAYDTPKMAVFMENIMFRVDRDSGAVGMKPEAFSYKPEWVSETHDLKHVLTATETQNIEIQGHTVVIEKGQKVHTLSSFKYPPDVFKSMIASVGYKSIDYILGDHNRMAAHLFQG
ncbi:L-histidine N(alpha)-methyltransferase [Roseofilum sp. BLCC_M154]|uniref:L-histidine N(Alpha)-methyltransferase n=1 Tax=Roseofilum acuticapitatum BLCC-M154 TaxID=3022444 RepID=A0ABT7AQZ2_9CYAN|nr:L-histidine N(alpha)-methyltransferase [Roseofilum acuticapitatum]MDJ1169315.1 L-histidine N(alpha)-methyltransferase [Roseofilum acuticapitatum BLCC-M154]